MYKRQTVTIYPFDESKVSDPSLIIYSPVRKVGNRLVVTNGDQTDTVCSFLERGATFEAALETREFEPDVPNFTPRISAMLDLGKGSGPMNHAFDIQSKFTKENSEAEQ